MSLLGSPRRYYLAKRQVALMEGDDGLAAVWRHKQEAETGTSLPVGFPHLSALTAKGYETQEDITGADSAEFTEQGFAPDEATEILLAHAEL